MIGEEAMKSSATGYISRKEISNVSKRRSLKHKFVDWIISGITEVSNEKNSMLAMNASNTIAAGPVESIDSDRSMHFKILRAHGGTIIETRMRDDRKDRLGQGLYIIRDDQDLGQEIAKIITTQALRG